MIDTKQEPKNEVLPPEHPILLDTIKQCVKSGTASSMEKLVVIVVFGALALLNTYKGDSAAATAYATIIVTYFMSREGT